MPKNIKHRLGYPRGELPVLKCRQLARQVGAFGDFAIESSVDLVNMIFPTGSRCISCAVRGGSAFPYRSPLSHMVNSSATSSRHQFRSLRRRLINGALVRHPTTIRIQWQLVSRQAVCNEDSCPETTSQYTPNRLRVCPKA
jgi:hypothetical protein